MSTLAPSLPAPAAMSFAQQLTAASSAQTGSSSGQTATPSTRTGSTSADTGSAQAQSAAWNRSAAFGTAGRLNGNGVPVDLAKYGNGKIPANALSQIGHGSHRLWAPAADAFTRMEAAAARDGIKIGVTDSYRSFEAQVDVARRKGLYSEGGLAAKPGTSDHGYGRSLDLDLDSKAQAWMRSNAGKHGLVEDTPHEPWHWTFSPPG